MRGQYFVHISADPQSPAARNVRRGQVINPVGPEFWLLKFQAKGYTFNNVLPAAALTEFAFFDTAADQMAFLMENFPPPLEPTAPEPVREMTQTEKNALAVGIIHDEHGPAVPA